MLKCYRADLHIHTCLSPCGDLSMSPRKIVAEALRKEIDIIGICDHNSAENIPAVTKAAQGKDVVVIPGMEVCTKEEIHVIALFDDIDSSFKLQSLVHDNLRGENDPEAFGMQVIANEFDEVEGFQTKLLIGASELPVELVVDTIHQLNGIAIASHIDRESYSVISQLGFIPETTKFDALEFSSNTSDAEARRRWHQYTHYPFVRNSDAHKLEDIGKGMCECTIREPSLQEIAKALRNEGGRTVRAI
ncbi:MAG: PHP domain-containing protein [Ignavibacteria bacterium]|nr:PHP domain-containing protein [Ignavibacteria bacterium]